MVDGQHLFLERGPGQRLALFINGDLQFDTADERRYHEYLVLPALAAIDAPTARILLLGGGDGLALREVLRERRVAAVDLVDLDPDVLALARTELRDLNEAALDDPRVAVRVGDARDFAAGAAERGERYDAIICDFTVPTDEAGCRLYSVEWFGLLRHLLAPGGALVTNAVSPFGAGHAFWSIHNALRAAGWDARPYHFTLPSFIAQGYGEWGFLLALGAPRDLAALDFAPGQELTPAAFREALRFPAACAATQAGAAPTTDERPHVLDYMLNPVPLAARAGDTPLDFAGENSLPLIPLGPGSEAFAGALQAALTDCLPADGTSAPDLDRLIAHLPVQHRYHTREMVAAILANWANYLRGLDLPLLLDTVLERATALPARIRAELVALRERLRDAIADPDRLVAWGGRVMGVLLIVIMLANTVAPDSVFAKTAGGHVTTARPSHTVTSSTAPRSRATLDSSGFGRSTYGLNQIVDVSGNAYPPRRFVYYRTRYHTHYYSTSRSRPGPTPAATPGASPVAAPGTLPVAAPVDAPVTENGLYYVTEDALILDNNDVVVTLDEANFLLVDEGVLVLLNTSSPEPLYGLYRDQAMLKPLVAELELQRQTIQGYIDDLSNGITRERWLGSVLPGVRHRSDELRNLQDTDRRLGETLAKLRAESAGAPPPAGAKEVFSGVFALPSGVVALHNADDTYSFLSGTMLYDTQAAAEARGPGGRAAAAGLRPLIVKMIAADLRDNQADLASFDADLAEIDTELAAVKKDLDDYTALQRTYGNTYQVDYGTKSIKASEAIALTQRDLDTLNAARAALVARRQSMLDEAGPFSAVQARAQ